MPATRNMLGPHANAIKMQMNTTAAAAAAAPLITLCPLRLQSVHTHIVVSPTTHRLMWPNYPSRGGGGETRFMFGLLSHPVPRGGPDSISCQLVSVTLSNQPWVNTRSGVRSCNVWSIHMAKVMSPQGQMTGKVVVTILIKHNPLLHTWDLGIEHYKYTVRTLFFVSLWCQARPKFSLLTRARHQSRSLTHSPKHVSLSLSLSPARILRAAIKSQKESQELA